MNLETTKLSPSAGRFIGLLVLSIIIIFPARLILDLLILSNPVDFKFYEWWLPNIFLVLGLALGETYGASRFQLTISFTEDPDGVMKSTLKLLSSNGRIKEKSESEATLVPVSLFYRLFNNWFGLELILVKIVDNKVIVEGPLRRIDELKYSLKS